MREVGYEGDYKFANRLLSHEHLALLLNEDDPHWVDFCNWVLQALITAEALNITQATAEMFPTTSVFGPEYENMFVNAIAASGNYAEMYERHYGETLPRSRYNMINTGETGLIVSDPLGTLLVDEESLPQEDLPGPLVNGTMEAVITRGHLLCGVNPNDEHRGAGFADYNSTTQEWSGLDIDYCRALAASVSAGKQIDTIFVALSDWDSRYQSLANMSIDVLAGEMISLISDVHEPTTEQGFTFSTPYFYSQHGNTTMVESDAFAHVTRQGDRGDHQWSDLAKWTIQATFYAEEKGIVQSTASEMPVVELFGIEYKQMFRDIIHTTGNYGEMYERNVQAYIPRSGRNLLNVEDTPQFFPLRFD